MRAGPGAAALAVLALPQPGRVADRVQQPHYYEDRLSSFPAPRSGVARRHNGFGICLVRVDGTFLRGAGTGKDLRTNPVEARRVVAEIRRRFAASPDVAPSIGVVTFNAQQRA